MIDVRPLITEMHRVITQLTQAGSALSALTGSTNNQPKRKLSAAARRRIAAAQRKRWIEWKRNAQRAIKKGSR